jgi:virginiamycin B lyase
MHRTAPALLLAALAVTCVAQAAGPSGPIDGASAVPACKTTAIPYPQTTLAVAAGSLWLACRDGSRVERRTMAGKLIATIKTPGLRPWSIAAFGGYVWVIDRELPYLVRISTTTNRKTQTTLGGTPIYVFGGGGSAWVVYDASGNVARINARTGKAGVSFRVGDGTSGFASSNGHIWLLAHRDGALVRLDGRHVTRLRPQAVSDTLTPERMALAGGSLWIAGRGKDLDRVDPATGKVLGTTEIGPGGIDLKTVGGKVAVVTVTAEASPRGDPFVASVKLVDPATGSVMRTYDTTSAMALNGMAVVGNTLALLDGLHGRVVFLAVG